VTYRTSASLLLLVVLLAAGTLPARASTVLTSTYGYTFPLTDLNFDAQASLDLFAPNLGDLTGVTLEFYFQFQPELGAYDDSTSSFIMTGGRIDVSDAGVVGPDGTLVAPGLMTYSFPPETVLPGDNSFPGPLFTSTHVIVHVPAANFASYIGYGQLINGLTFKAPSITAYANVSGPLQGKVFVGGGADVGGAGWITYTYTVPEPATFALLGLGFILLLSQHLLAKRRGVEPRY
jgi:hypothetical protein